MDSNPYKPPDTEVSDRGDLQPPPARPFNVTWGVRLLWVYLLAGLPSLIDLLAPRPLTGPRDELTERFIVVFQGISIFSFGLMSLLNVFCWKGRNWARITHLVLLSIALLASVWAVSWTLRGPAYQVTVYLLQTGLNIAGVALLFTPSASGWYRRMRRP